MYDNITFGNYETVLAETMVSQNGNKFRVAIHGRATPGNLQKARELLQRVVVDMEPAEPPEEIDACALADAAYAEMMEDQERDD